MLPAGQQSSDNECLLTKFKPKGTKYKGLNAAGGLNLLHVLPNHVFRQLFQRNLSSTRLALLEMNLEFPCYTIGKRSINSITSAPLGFFTVHNTTLRNKITSTLLSSLVAFDYSLLFRVLEQYCLQQLPPPMEARSDGSDWTLNELRNLLVRQSLDVAEDDDGSKIVRQTL